MIDDMAIRKLRNQINSLPKLPSWSNLMANGSDKIMEQLKVQINF